MFTDYKIEDQEIYIDEYEELEKINKLLKYYNADLTEEEEKENENDYYMPMLQHHKNKGRK